MTVGTWGEPEKKWSAVGFIILWENQPTDLWWQIVMHNQEPKGKIPGTMHLKSKQRHTRLWWETLTQLWLTAAKDCWTHRSLNFFNSFSYIIFGNITSWNLSYLFKESMTADGPQLRMVQLVIIWISNDIFSIETILWILVFSWASDILEDTAVALVAEAVSSQSHNHQSKQRVFYTARYC